MAQDGAASETVDLSGVSTDNQKIDKFTLTGTTIELSAEDDGEVDNTIDLGATFATDAEVTAAVAASALLDLDKVIGNESVTGLTFDGTTLTLAQDGAASETVDLSGVSTDNQKIDKFTLTGTTIELSAEDDGEVDKTIDLGATFATDAEVTAAVAASSLLDLDKVIGNESVTGLTFDGTTLTLAQDGAASETVDLSGVSTDNQKIDKFTLTGTTIELSAEDDGEVDKTIDLGATFATDAEVTAAVAASSLLDLDKVIGNESVTGLTFDGTTLTLAQDGAASETVDLSGVSTDNQKIDKFTLTGTTIELSAEDDGEVDKTIDLGATFATDAEVTAAVAASALLDLDKVIGNESVTGLTFDGTTLTLTQDVGGDQTINLSSVDNQKATEVNLDTPIDVDGDGTTETTVEDVIQDIAAITSKSARIFYPPSIEIDASTTGTLRTVNLYTQYTSQYATPAVASSGAPAAIPTYTAAELYYYVTYYDTAVFANVSVNAAGLMTYDIIATPTSYNSLINVVFVVK